MSDESRHQESPDDPRSLTEGERILLSGLVVQHPEHERLLAQLERVCVVPLTDGGMGSFRFVSDRPDRVLGQLVAEVSFIDADGVEGSIQVNLDDAGDLFEFDVWKVDFSPLKELPLLDRCVKVQRQ
jgi:hypothetical protein